MVSPASAMTDQRVVPAFGECSQGGLENGVYPKVAQIICVRSQLIGPLLACFRIQVGAQEHFGPDGTEVVEEGARLAFRVVEFLPAGEVLVGDRIENGQRRGCVAVVQVSRDLGEHAAHARDDAAHHPVGLR